MKLARLFFAIALMFLASLGLWALQLGGGFGGQQLSITGEREEPSEFYFSRLQYNCLWISRFSRRLVPGLSQSRQRLPDCHPASDPHRRSGAAKRCGSRQRPAL